MTKKTREIKSDPKFLDSAYGSSFASEKGLCTRGGGVRWWERELAERR